MKLQELYKPKIAEPIASAFKDYAKAAAATRSKQAGDKDRELLRAVLEKAGWEFLDAGCFSHVWVKPGKNYVLKINKSPDPGYARYVKLIKQNPNPHFPKISDMRDIYIKGPGLDPDDKHYYAYLIEKLQPLPQRYGSNWSMLCSDVANYKGSLMELFNRKMPNLFKRFPKLLKALQLVQDNQSWNNIDLHANNIMKRSDGTLVITDPYS